MSDDIARFKLHSAYHYGLLAYRQQQPLDDNPHKRGSPEWHAWVSGWALLRDALEHERARAEWAEQKLVEAMEAGLAETTRLREAVDLMESTGMAIGHIVLDPQEGSAEERCQHAFDAAKNICDVAEAAQRGASTAEMWAVSGWSRGDGEIEALAVGYEDVAKRLSGSEFLERMAPYAADYAAELAELPTPEEAEARMMADAPAIKARVEAYCSIARETEEPAGPLCGSMELLEEADEGDW